jgi:CRP/FNR family cyclic AMP-dependent transcriptional regulator
LLLLFPPRASIFKSSEPDVAFARLCAAPVFAARLQGEDDFMRKVLFLFGILDDRDIEWMISTGRVTTVPSGTVLIEQERPLDSVFVVLDGVLSVRILQKGAGRELARLHAGEVVGEMSFVDSRPPSATVTALENTRVLAIPRAELRRRLGDSGFAARFYHALALFLADRLRATSAGYGVGEPQQSPVPDAVEIDPLILDHVSVAGMRFDHMLRRLSNR